MSPSFIGGEQGLSSLTVSPTDCVEPAVSGILSILLTVFIVFRSVFVDKPCQRFSCSCGLPEEPALAWLTPPSWLVFSGSFHPLRLLVPLPSPASQLLLFIFFLMFAGGYSECSF